MVSILIFCYAVFFTSLIIFTKNFQPFSRKKENLTFNLEMLENVSVIAFGYNAETLPLLFYFFEFVCSGKKLCNCHSFLFSFAPCSLLLFSFAPSLFLDGVAKVLLFHHSLPNKQVTRIDLIPRAHWPTLLSLFIVKFCVCHFNLSSALEINRMANLSDSMWNLALQPLKTLNLHYYNA